MADPEKAITIVIVEDHEIKRVALKHSLGRVEGFEITGEAVDGISAVKKAVNLKPDVVVVDAGLPLIDGIEVTRQIKSQLPDAQIMMMATEGSGIDIFAMINAGANAYCQKCISNDQLEMAVRTIASGGMWLDQTIASRVLQTAGACGKAPPQANWKLSSREQQVLKLLVDGLTNHEIAGRLYISIETVKTHVRHIIDKLGVKGRTEAAVKAIQENLASEPDAK